MFIERKSHLIPAIVILAGIVSVTACTVDKSYDIDPKALDLSVSLLEDGVSIPIGSSNTISLGDLINSAGEGINKYIDANADEITLKYEGSTSLNQQLADLDLANMAVIDGVSFDGNFDYKLGDFNADDFKISGAEYPLNETFKGMDLIDVKVNSISATLNGIDFHAGLDKFKQTVSGNADLDLSSKIGTVHYDNDVLSKGSIAAAVAAYPFEEVVIPAAVLHDVVLPDKNVKVELAQIKLHDDVTSIKNIKLDPNAKLVVSMRLENAFVTGGHVVPDVTLDFSKLFKIKGGNAVNLKNQELNAANNWASSQTYDIESLVKTDFDGAISINENVAVSGKVELNDLVTSKTAFNAAAGDMRIKIDVSFSNLTVASAELAVVAEPYEHSDQLSLADFDVAHLSDGIIDVSNVLMDESKPVKLLIIPNNLDRLKQKNLEYSLTISFPPSIIVEDAVDGKLVFTGDLADGPVTKNIVLKDIEPTVSDGKLSMHAKVDVSAKVVPKNLVIDSANIPANPNEDLSFSVKVEGTPVIKDYKIRLDHFEESEDLEGNLSLEAEGLGSFGDFHIIPVGKPAIRVKFNIPSVQGANLIPGGSGIKICMPDFIKLDSSGISPEYGYNTADNSITIKNSFPEYLDLPVKELYVKPVQEGGKTFIKGSYSATGSICIPSAEVHQNDLKEIFGAEVGITIIVPDIKTASITLDDKLSFDVNQKFNLTIKNLPPELKKIDEILLKDVYVSLDAEFDGLPSSAQFNLDLKATLPKFFSPNEIPIKGKIVNGKLTSTPVKLEKLYNIDTTENPEIKDEISIVGTIEADGTSLDVAELKPVIKARIIAGIKDKSGKIAISKASGVFSYQVEEETLMDMTKLPGILRSDVISLDLADPLLNLDITTNLGIPMTANLELIPVINGSEVIANKVVLENLKLPYSSTASKTDTKSYCICKEASSAPAGREFIQADITKMLKQLPDNLKVKIVANVDPTVTSVLEPAATYTLDIKYDVNVPLSFGSDFSFTTDTEIDLSGAASIISMGDFGIKGQVLNNSPLNLSVDMALLDADGNIIPQTKSSTVNIAGAKTSDVEFYLSPSDRSKTVSKARFTIKVTAIPNVPVKKTDTIKFIDLVAVAPGGISFDIK